MGLTTEELDDFFEAQRGQLELLTMFELLATAEAILRLDFRVRVEHRRKDDLSRHFRRIYKRVGDKVRMDEDILSALREHGLPGGVVSDMRAALRLRHWLAHGRHWHPKLGRGYTPGDVFDITKALVEALPE